MRFYLGKPPYVNLFLLNPETFDLHTHLRITGSTNDGMTMAHELGHAWVFPMLPAAAQEKDSPFYEELVSRKSDTKSLGRVKSIVREIS
jgi:hypothetical protein